MEITCYREAAIASETRYLPADLYNLAVRLIAHASPGPVFVPIRTMQYLAILDRDEFVFIDSERKCWVDIAWQHFRPQARTSLIDPVQYEVKYYRPESIDWMRRLQGEFPLALRQMADKQLRNSSPGSVLIFPQRD